METVNPTLYKETDEYYAFESRNVILNDLVDSKKSYDRSKQVFLSYQRKIEKKGYRCFDIDTYTNYGRQIIKQGYEMFTQYSKYCFIVSDESLASTKDLSQRRAWLKNERVHHLWQVSMIVRYNIRTRFGIEKIIKCGHFLDRCMSSIIHEYAYSVDYSWYNNNLIGHTGSVQCASVSSDGRYLFFSGGMDTMIGVWDLCGKEMIEQMNTDSGIVQSLDYKFGRLASGIDDSLILIWDAYTLELITKLKGHTASVYSVCFNQTGNKLISGSKDKTIRLWSVQTGQCLTYFIGHENSVNAALFLDNHVVISGSHDGCVKVWDVCSGFGYCTITQGIHGEVTDVRVNCDSSLIAVFTRDSLVTIFSLSELNVVLVLPQRSLKGRFHPTLPYLLAVSDSLSYSVRLYDVINGELIGVFYGHLNCINDLCFSTDGTRLVSVSDDQSIRVWDLHSGLFQVH